MKKFPTVAIVSFAMLASMGCQTGEHCLAELKNIEKEALDLFSIGDSVAFMNLTERAQRLVSCVDESTDVTNIQKGAAHLTAETLAKLEQGLPCRCYVLKLNSVYEEMNGVEEWPVNQWRAVYAKWEQVERATELSINKLSRDCATEDLANLMEMKAEVEGWNGYHEAGDLMEDVQDVISTAVSTAKGIFHRLGEEFEKAND